jgi:hypothetical protein
MCGFGAAAAARAQPPQHSATTAAAAARRSVAIVARAGEAADVRFVVSEQSLKRVVV